MADPRNDRATSVWHLLVGPPRSARGTGKERITPVEGLSALSLDALTSVAYGPEAIILVLAVAGAGALHLVLPITIAIVALLAILVFSYRQVIDAYPVGGGAYAVSRANLGAAHEPRRRRLARRRLHAHRRRLHRRRRGLARSPPSPPSTGPPSRSAWASSSSSPCSTSAAWARRPGPSCSPPWSSSSACSPSSPSGSSTPSACTSRRSGKSQLPTTGLKAVTVLLVLKAFSAGCSALTGVEAIANGVPLFREPRAVRAKRTEVLLGVILGTMLLGLAVLAKRWQIGPRTGQTVLSQIMAMAVGRGWAYYIVSITITVVLALAANTSFGGLPVLASLLARDNYLPHLFTMRGDRQVFANGIVVLALLAGALLVAVGGNTNTLIPLFAIGVFIGFTLSQTGLVVHWRRDPAARLAPARRHQRDRRRDHRHRHHRLPRLQVHRGGLGGGHRHPGLHRAVPPHPRLLRTGRQGAAASTRTPPKPAPKRTIVIVPVNRVSRLTEHALCEAESLGQEVIAVTVVLAGWRRGRPLHRQAPRRVAASGIPACPSRCCTPTTRPSSSPSSRSSTRCAHDHPDDQIVVLIPVVRPDKLRYRILHNQIDLVLSERSAQPRRRRGRPGHHAAPPRRPPRRPTGGVDRAAAAAVVPAYPLIAVTGAGQLSRPSPVLSDPSRPDHASR